MSRTAYNTLRAGFATQINIPYHASLEFLPHSDLNLWLGTHSLRSLTLRTHAPPQIRFRAYFPLSHSIISPQPPSTPSNIPSVITALHSLGWITGLSKMKVEIWNDHATLNTHPITKLKPTPRYHNHAVRTAYRVYRVKYLG